ncbi:unnamed protein product [Schistosoma turkestanicum]|nr:unnamed protein product [Schistosoma turkestanicum]
MKTMMYELEPRLQSVNLACDIDVANQPESSTNRLYITIAMFFNEMSIAFSSMDWSRLFRNALINRQMNRNNALITEFHDIEINSQLIDENINWCNELETVISETYEGFQNALEQCSIAENDGTFQLKLSTTKLLKEGYCCNPSNIMRRAFCCFYRDYSIGLLGKFFLSTENNR